jgi:oligoendopeptidase F
MSLEGTLQVGLPRSVRSAAEVPSTVAELQVEHLLSTDEDLGRALLAWELDQGRVHVRSVRAFEQAAYALRAEGQALNADRLNALARVFGNIP